MITRIAISLLLAVGLSSMGTAAETNRPTVIPQPEKMVLSDGVFTLGPQTMIVAGPKTHITGEYLAKLLRVPTGFDLQIRKNSPSNDPVNCIILRLVSGKEDLGPEGYELKVSKDRVVIEAPTEAGAFYGVQTLRQLLPAAVESENPTTGVDWCVPCVQIEDKPRYAWRGLMLDPGHNFLTKEFTKRYIDTMACYKMNRLHWHLTDMGWAIEIKKYPQLTNLKKRTPITNRWRKAYGKCTHGFYTQEDIREIVAYAAERHVMIIPEIELPGHSSSALACYPELCCPNWKSKVKQVRSYSDYRCAYCAGNDKAFEFLEDVLSEVVELFPAPIVHIGGDERRGFWRNCPLCQARIKAEGLKDVSELQSYFIKRIAKFLASKNRQIMGWTEIVEGGLPPGAMLQSWLEPKHAVDAAKQGHDVVMSTHGNCYLNYLGLSLEKCYSFEPTPPGLKPEVAKHILGVEPCLWGFPQHRHDELLFPRVCAFAEVGWSQKDARDWSNFKTRLGAHGRRLDEIGINYHRDPSVWSK